jgi:hypothetical protein
MKAAEKMGLGTFLVRTFPWCKFSSYSWSSSCPKLNPHKYPPPPQKKIQITVPLGTAILTKVFNSAIVAEGTKGKCLDPGIQEMPRKK